LNKILAPLCEVYANLELFHNALDIMERWQYSIYDSLIIAAALYTDCKILYFEDLQHRQKIELLTIMNPFV